MVISSPTRSGFRRLSVTFGLMIAISASSTAVSVFRAQPGSAAAVTIPKPGVVTISMAMVGDPGNPSVGVIQTFGLTGTKGQSVAPPENSGSTGIYKNCSDVPSSVQKQCLTVGGVTYKYGIGEFETTVSQYVTFLNTVDPRGRNTLQLYFDDMNPTNWPKYGSISYSSAAAAGQHYTVAYPEWANKPFNFASLSRADRFVNSLTNGKVLAKKSSTSGGFEYVTYTVRLSPKTETGMYRLRNSTTKRSRSSGFVLPSNNEWIKSAYYDPKGGGTDSYWAYPTGPFNAPKVAVLNPANGDVQNPSDQPLSTYNPQDPNSSVDTPGGPTGAAPNWCPSQVGSTCNNLPADFPTGLDLEKNYQSNVSTVGQDKTPSPWGTYDEAGNVVELLDTKAPQPPGYNFLRNWNYYHGGVANAPAYQLEISAFGYAPGDFAIQRAYPWLGFRVGVIGNL